MKIVSVERSIQTCPIQEHPIAQHLFFILPVILWETLDLYSTALGMLAVFLNPMVDQEWYLQTAGQEWVGERQWVSYSTLAWRLGFCVLWVSRRVIWSCYSEQPALSVGQNKHNARCMVCCPICLRTFQSFKSTVKNGDVWSPLVRQQDSTSRARTDVPLLPFPTPLHHCVVRRNRE